MKRRTRQASPQASGTAPNAGEPWLLVLRPARRTIIVLQLHQPDPLAHSTPACKRLIMPISRIVVGFSGHTGVARQGIPTLLHVCTPHRAGVADKDYATLCNGCFDLSQHARELRSLDVKQHGVGEDTVEMLARQIQGVEVLLQSRSSWTKLHAAQC